MKKIIVTSLLLISTLLNFAQTQIGQDIDGESAYSYAGTSVSLSNDGSIVAIGADANSNANGDAAGQVRVYQNNSGVWTQIGQDIDGESANSYAGTSVSLSNDGSIVAIAAYNTNPTGHVRMYQNLSGVWTQIGQDINLVITLGQKCRTLSLSGNGNIVAIGVGGETNNWAGKTRVYQNISGVWTQIGADIDGESAHSYAGYSVSLSNDGNILAIGAPGNTNANGNSAGQTRVYRNIAGVWTQIGADIDGEAAVDNAGSSVSLSGDGSMVAIGAPRNINANGSGAGQTRVYRNIAEVWTQIGADIDGEAADNNAGSSVSLSNDGSIVAIGAPYNSNIGTNAGHVRVYRNISGVWTQIGIDIDGESEYSNAGASVSLSSNGSIVAIGANRNTNPNGDKAGQTRVYELSVALSTNELAHINTKIYPNPAKDFITIKNTSNLTFNKILITDLTGKKVMEQNNVSSTIDVSKLQIGLFIIQLRSNEKTVVKKFIKN